MLKSFLEETQKGFFMSIDLDNPIYDLKHIQTMFKLWFEFKDSLQRYDNPTHIIYNDYDFVKLTGMGIYQLEDEYGNKMYYDAKRKSFIVAIPNEERIFYNFFNSGALRSLYSATQGLIYQFEEDEYETFGEMDEDQMFYLQFMLMRKEK